MPRSSPDGAGEEQLGVRLHTRLQMFVRGTLLDRRARPTVVSSACAVSRVAPGASTPKTVMPGPERGAWSSIVRPQRHPQVVRDRELEALAHHADHCRVLVPSCTVRPSTSGSLPKRVRHTS